MTCQEAFQLYLGDMSVRWSPATTEISQRAGKSFLTFRGLGTTPITEVSLRDLADWTLTLQKRHKVKDSYIFLLRTRIGWFFKWATDFKHVAVNPFDLSKLPKVLNAPCPKHAISWEQHTKILTFADSPVCRWRYWSTACRIAWSTGLRMSDVVDLEWSNLSVENKCLTVLPRKTKRFQRRIDIPVDDDLLRHLGELRGHPIEEWHRRVPYILPDMHAMYHWKRRDLIVVEFGLIRKKSGIVSVTFHSYRHAFISRLVNSGASMAVVCAITGLSLRILLNYCHVSMEAKRDAVNTSLGYINQPVMQQLQAAGVDLQPRSIKTSASCAALSGCESGLTGPAALESPSSDAMNNPPACHHHP